MKEGLEVRIKLCVRFLVILMLVALVLTGCTKGKGIAQTEEDGTKQQVATSNVKGSHVKRVKIYTAGFTYIRDILGAYESRYPDVIVETIEIFEYKEYQERIKKDLLVGHGPDVIIFESSTFPNIEKVAETGVFYDMKELFQQDSEMDLSEFNESVLSSGQFDGKQLFIPINYTVPMLMTTKEIQEDYDFRLTDIKSMEDLLLIMEKIKLENPEVTLLGPERLITSFFLDKDLAFYDLKTKGANIRTTEFSQAIEEYIQLKRYSDKERTSYDQEKIYNGLFNKEMIFYNSEYGKVLNYMELDAYLKTKGQKGIDFIPFPQPEGTSNRIATPFMCMGINNNSKNKEEAYNFIKMATNSITVCPLYQSTRWLLRAN